MNVEELPFDGDFEEFCRELVRRLKYYGYRADGEPIPTYEEVRTHPSIKNELSVAGWISKYFSQYINITELELIWRSYDDSLITPEYCFNKLLVDWPNYPEALQNRTPTNAEVSSSALKEVLRKYAELPQQSSLDKPSSTNVFRKKGDFWEMHHEGVQGPPLKNLRGYEYIRRALQGEEFKNPLDLYYAVKGAPEVSQGHREESLSVSTGYERLQQTENESKLKSDMASKKRLLELTKEREEADRDNDKARLILIDKELEQINQELKLNTVSRKRKQWDPQNEKARKSISNAIRRAITEIEKHNNVLAEHLKAHLTPVRFPYQYTADPSKTWETE